MRSSLRQGALPGALVLLGSFALLAVVNGGFSVMGYQDARITKMVLSGHLGTLVGTLAALLAAHVVVGAGLGLAWRATLGGFATGWRVAAGSPSPTCWCGRTTSSGCRRCTPRPCTTRGAGGRPCSGP